MSKPILYLSGQRFMNLVVMSRVENTPAGKVRFRCKCDCGNIREVVGSQLKNGSTKSCGCLQPSLASAASTTHGRSKTSAYRAWAAMWSRCTNVNTPGFKKYQFRTPPKEWESFEVFYAEVGDPPGRGYSLDRTDNSKPYGPGNVRWATRLEQNQNQSSNVNITLEGKTQCAAAWERELGLPHNVLRQRIKRLGLERAIRL
jgi:hypothetical protein